MCLGEKADRVLKETKSQEKALERAESQELKEEETGENRISGGPSHRGRMGPLTWPEGRLTGQMLPSQARPAPTRNSSRAIHI